MKYSALSRVLAYCLYQEFLDKNLVLYLDKVFAKYHWFLST